MESDAQDFFHFAAAGSRHGTSRGLDPGECTRSRSSLGRGLGISIQRRRQDRPVAPARMLPPQRKTSLRDDFVWRRGWVGWNSWSIGGRFMPLGATSGSASGSNLSCARYGQRAMAWLPDANSRRTEYRAFPRRRRAPLPAQTRPSHYFPSLANRSRSRPQCRAAFGTLCRKPVSLTGVSHNGVRHNFHQTTPIH
jgi:hypothetical protein